MVRAFLSLVAIAVLAACGEAFPAGSARNDGGAGSPPDDGEAGSGGTSLPPPPADGVTLGSPIRLLAGGGFASHALLADGEALLAVATRDRATSGGPRSDVWWTRVDARDSVEPERTLEQSFEVPGGVLRIGGVALAAREAFVAMASADAYFTQAFDLDSGAELSSSSGGAVGRPPPRPLLPSMVYYPPGFLGFYNGWARIDAQFDGLGSSVSYRGLYAGFDPYVVRAGDRAWLAWNDDAGARMARLGGGEPPRTEEVVELGAAANGPVLAAGADRILALTWGERLAAHLVSLDPPALEGTAIVEVGAISGRPAAIPWSGGFLVTWADAAGTAIRGLRLDATGAALDPAPFTLLALDEPVAFEPTHAIASATGGWLTWVTTTGLYGARLSLP